MPPKLENIFRSQKWLFKRKANNQSIRKNNQASEKKIKHLQQSESFDNWKGFGSKFYKQVLPNWTLSHNRLTEVLG